MLLLARVFDLLQERNSCGNIQDAPREERERWERLAQTPAERDEDELLDEDELQPA